MHQQDTPMTRDKRQPRSGALDEPWPPRHGRCGDAVLVHPVLEQPKRVLRHDGKLFVRFDRTLNALGRL